MLNFPQPPPGGYKVIVVDPPWPFARHQNYRKYTGVYGNLPIENRYPLMPLPEIKALPVRELAADACLCFIWTTQRFLPAALECLADWNFRYRFLMTWHKPAGPQPVGYPCFNGEFVVVGNLGNNSGGYMAKRTPGFCDTKQFSAVFTAPRGQHSEKPAYFYQLLARVTPAPRIDLFARKRHNGFDAWGNQLDETPRLL